MYSVYCYVHMYTLAVHDIINIVSMNCYLIA